MQMMLPPPFDEFTEPSSDVGRPSGTLPLAPPFASSPILTPLNSITPPFCVGGTAVPGPIVVSVPHAGRHYATEMFTHITAEAAASLEDTGSDQLGLSLARDDRPVLIASCARAVCDLNRPEHCLDPLLCEDDVAVAEDVYYRYIMAGYGVIPRLDSRKQPLHDTLCTELISNVLSCHHRPYHDRLETLLEAASEHHPHVMLLDIHTMPDSSRWQNVRGTGSALSDIVLGSLHGATLQQQHARLIDDVLSKSGLSWKWNAPYAGGYITRHYGLKPSIGSQAADISALQIECNRNTFLDRAGALRADNFARVQKLLADIADILADALSA